LGTLPWLSRIYPLHGRVAIGGISGFWKFKASEGSRRRGPKT